MRDITYSILLVSLLVMTGCASVPMETAEKNSIAKKLNPPSGGSSVVVADDLQDATDAYERKDYETAYKLALPLAEQGNVFAQHNLALMYYNGQGVPQNNKKALKWERLAAEQGYAETQFILGVRYYKGQGVPQDYKEAVKWFRLSAEQGYSVAQSTLGNRYAAKGQGVPQDYALAHMWWNICGSGGDEDCVKNKNIVEKKMSKQQIEKAQEMARNWKPKK